MIDLDELERKMHEAFRAHTDMDDWRDAVLELNAALRINCPELIAMARRYQWLRNEAWYTSRAAPAVCMVDGAGRPFLCRETRYVEPILEGSSLDEAIDAAMQEQKP